MRWGSGHWESAVDRGREPVLLLRLEPWYRVFLGNLKDLAWRRRQPPLRITSPLAPFWPDVFVSRRLPWGRFGESAIFHAVAIVLMWAGSQFLLLQPRPMQRPIFHKSDVIYYSASEYLPPLNTGVATARTAQKGDPEYAPQPIISVPPEPDNRTQTIVTPPQVKLNQDVPLPNVVAWSEEELPGVPLAATARAADELRLPTVATAVVAPAPEVAKVETEPAPSLPQGIVPPPPGVDLASARQPIRGPQPRVIEPPPNVDASIQRRGDINIGASQVVPPAPQLPVAAQHSFALAGAAAAGKLPQAVIPPPPSVGAAGPTRAGGRLITLGIHPAPPSGSVEPPAGNRRGRFAATPEGKQGAAGTPDLTANSQASGQGTAAGNLRSASELPFGLVVGTPPQHSQRSTIAGQGGANGTGSSSFRLPPQSSSLMARAIIPSRVSSQPAAEVPEPKATEVDRRVFHDHKFYSMTLNLPNLNSAGGSWVIHFAELNATSGGTLIAPLPTRAVDPAYPAELMRENVQGTVTLYAVIHSDGSVGDVRVLEGTNDRLNEYAREALVRWHFRPASKNGSAVALEAVVTIPFRAHSAF